MELIQKFADNKLLAEDNIVPRLSLSDILNDNYEITTFFGPEKVDTKITVELGLIEEQLAHSLSTTKTNLNEFKETLQQYSPKLSLERYWSGSSATIHDELLKLDLLLRVIGEIEELYTRTNTYSKTLAPILRTGGYRSLLLCLNESLARINQSIESALKKNSGASGGSTSSSNLQRKKTFLRSFRNESIRRLKPDAKEQTNSDPLLRKSREEPPPSLPTLRPRKVSHRRSRSQDDKNKPPPDPPAPHSAGEQREVVLGGSISFAKSPLTSSNPLNPPPDKKYRSKRRKAEGKGEGREEGSDSPLDGRCDKAERVQGNIDASGGEEMEEAEKGRVQSASAPLIPSDLPKKKKKERRAPNLEMKKSVMVPLTAQPPEEEAEVVDSLHSKLQFIDGLIRNEGLLSSDQFLQSKSNLEKLLASERDRIKLTKEAERERLKQQLKEVDREEKEELAHLEKTVRGKLKALEEKVEVKAEVKTTIGSNSKLFKLVCIRCAKSFDLLENLKGKLIVCTSIAQGTTFLGIDDLYAPHPDIDRNSVFARHHFGYELNKDLREYSKKMKVVYCAVADSRYPDKKSKDAAIKGIIKQMYFSWAAVKYSLSSKSASDQYGDLRANLDVNFVKDVWDLLEDPITNFFATQFGFAAAMEKMKINLDVRIPVNANDIFDVQLPAYHHNRVVKKIEWGDDEIEGKYASKTYRIRCRYISQYASEVDPSLVLKSLKSRANFVEEFVAEAPPDKLKRRSLLLSSPSSDLSDPPDALLQNAIVLHIHGGGWVSQSPDQHLPYVSEWGKYAQLPVLSIDYSLSPEIQYPIPVNECFAIYKWLLDPSNLKKLGLPAFKEPIRIILCGDSAGGNLSCATTIRAIQENVRLPIGLLLHYPAINLTETGSLSRLIFSNDPILNYETMRVVLECYLGSLRSHADTQPLMSPGLASDEILSKFPSTVICVGDVDPLIDDSTFLFSRLQSLGVNAILKVYRALPHGFLNLPTQLPKARKAIAEAGVYVEWLYKEYLEKLAFEEEMKKNSNANSKSSSLAVTQRFIDATNLRFRSAHDIGGLVPNLKELVDSFDSDDYDEIEGIPVTNSSI